MRLVTGIRVLSTAILLACAPSFDPPPTPALIASMPDTIPCSKAVKVDAGSERQGINAERRWLNAYYPKHSSYGQALRGEGDRKFDVLTFRRANGATASVCFDITSFFGRY